MELDLESRAVAFLKDRPAQYFSLAKLKKKLGAKTTGALASALRKHIDSGVLECDMHDGGSGHINHVWVSGGGAVRKT